jgi:hypothetical protein
MEAIARGHRVDFETECERTNKLLAELLKSSIENASSPGESGSARREVVDTNATIAAPAGGCLLTLSCRKVPPTCARASDALPDSIDTLSPGVAEQPNIVGRVQRLLGPRAAGATAGPAQQRKKCKMVL